MLVNQKMAEVKTSWNCISYRVRLRRIVYMKIKYIFFNLPLLTSMRPGMVWLVGSSRISVLHMKTTFFYSKDHVPKINSKRDVRSHMWPQKEALDCRLASHRSASLSIICWCWKNYFPSNILIGKTHFIVVEHRLKHNKVFTFMIETSISTKYTIFFLFQQLYFHKVQVQIKNLRFADLATLQIYNCFRTSTFSL